MIKYIRKNQKKALAFFGIVLMIAFALPMGFGQGRNSGPGDRKVATVLGRPVMSSESIRLKNEWDALKRQYGPGGLTLALGATLAGDPAFTVRGLTDPQTARQAELYRMMLENNPFQARMLTQRNPELRVIGNYLELGAQAYGQIDNSKSEDAFMLLVLEARAAGIGADDYTLLAIVGEPPESGDRNNYETVRAMTRDFLSVANNARRAGTVFKVSQPFRDYVRGTQYQEISVNVLEFDAKDYLAKVPAPTDDEVRAQFDKYKAADPKADPSGFGYKFPNRVKFDAVTIAADEVRKAVKPVRREDAADWYYEHQKTGDLPTTQETDTFSLKPTRTQTFAEAEPKIIENLTAKRVDELTTTIREAVRSTMRADYDAWRAATEAKKQPMPVSSLGVAYDSFEYLKKLRDKIQADHKVTLTISDTGDWRSADDLAKDYAGLMLDTGGMGRRPTVRFGQYLTEAPEPFQAGGQQSATEGRAAVWQPLPVFEDQGAKREVIARVTAAQPAHEPAKLDDVRDRVVADVKQAKAYAMAKEAATKALAQAKSGQWLQGVANSENKPMITTELFDAGDGSTSMFGFEMPIPGYTLPEGAQKLFKRAAFALLSEGQRTGEAPRPASRPSSGPTSKATSTPVAAGATATKPATAPTTVAVVPPGTTQPISTAFRDHPVGLVELPAAGKAVVVEVDQIKPRWNKSSANLFETHAGDAQREEARRAIAAEWFAYDNVVARTNYKPEDTRKQSQPQPGRPLMPDKTSNPFVP